MNDDEVTSDGPLPAETDARRMARALVQAREAAEAGEVPVGAVIYHGARLVAQAANSVERLKDPTAHAEILAITQAAAALGDWRLLGTTLYVTKEPCPMCAGAIVLARIPRVVWGADDPERGGARSHFGILSSPVLNHRPELTRGVCEAECRDLLLAFFRERRRERRAEPGAGD